MIGQISWIIESLSNTPTFLETNEVRTVYRVLRGRIVRSQIEQVGRGCHCRTGECCNDSEEALRQGERHFAKLGGGMLTTIRGK